MNYEVRQLEADDGVMTMGLQNDGTIDCQEDLFFFLYVIKEESILSTSNILLWRYSYSLSSTNHNSLEIISCVSSSAADHFAIYKKWIVSHSQFLWSHSAMFDAMDTEHLFIWSTREYVSVFGYFFVITYISLQSWIAFCQTSNF